MLIDWFTVIAQAINFLILVWLLKRYLYQPILHAIDERERHIAATISDTQEAQAAAQLQCDEFQKKNATFDKERAGLLNQAQLDAQQERQRLLTEARTSADEFAAKRMASLNNEALQLNQALMRKTEHAVFSIARKTLQDLATISLEQQMVEVFTSRLHSLDETSKALLAAAIKTASEPGLLRSTLDLPTEQRNRIQQVINENFAAEIPLHFETATDLVSGVEFSINGQKLAWSIADYLRILEQSIDELIKQPGLSAIHAETDE
ncbi:F0F1 ATP synthase subunit B [Methylomonas sp. AM2-LC]|uniref:F0F1 ATP synthase subunit B family protein n=1 Tax=Methylomonas sp. AM2-LC TaxID=3153301 RepID=UPI003267C6C3